MNKIVCPWIENYLVVEVDGYTRPCCFTVSKSTQISNINNGILKSFNDPKLLHLRNTLKEEGFAPDTLSYCRKCKETEDTGNKSVRQRINSLSSTRELKAIQFKMSNRCQLVCAHCNPTLSSSWAKFNGINPAVSNGMNLTPEFLEEIDKLLPQLELIKFTGGEPFLDANHWKLLEHLQKNKHRSTCTLEYITNGLVKPNFKLWEGWKSVTVSVSVDGYEEYYEWFRRRAKWNKLLTRINDLKNNSNLHIIYSISPWTISSYKKTKEYFKDINLYTTVVVDPDYASLKYFPKSLLEEYKDVPFNTFVFEDENLDLYINWAKNWDIKWKTPGWSERLFPWVC